LHKCWPERLPAQAALAALASALLAWAPLAHARGYTPQGRCGGYDRVSIGSPAGTCVALERVDDLYAAALECNRDEFEAMVRSLHRGASKGQCAEIARFHSNP